MIRSINPATGHPLATYAEYPPEEMERRLDLASAAWEEWREVPFSERTEALEDAANLLEHNRDRFARLMAEEMGKPVSEGRGEIDKCVWVCRHYAVHAQRYLAAEEIETDARRSLVRCDPLGPVLAVMPWNFPFWQVFRFAAPALMAGNVGLLKHASNVPGCALAIEEVFDGAEFPEGCFQTLLIGADAALELVADERISAVTLTGSEPAGRAVASRAGAHLKKTVLELGGSDPFIVLADADLATAAQTAARARLINGGQSCIAAKRFIVVESVAEEFTRRLVEHVEAMKVGDPLDPETQVGPLAREDLVTELHSQVERTLAAGARLLTGGHRLDRPGFFYAPTVLTGVAPDHAVAREETFGPVAPVLTARSEEEAIELANGTSFGLGASLWTRNPSRAEKWIPLIQAGAVFVNGLVKSDPRLPFGGIRNSGYGRELGREGIREFVNLKTVWMA